MLIYMLLGIMWVLGLALSCNESNTVLLNVAGLVLFVITNVLVFVFSCKADKQYYRR